VFTKQEIDSLVRLCGASEFFGEMIASRTSLIHAVNANPGMAQPRDYLSELRGRRITSAKLPRGNCTLCDGSGQLCWLRLAREMPRVN